MPASDTPAARLLHFNRDVLTEALALAVAHDAPGAPPYARPVGAHLRHVIEHYEALLMPAAAGVVDYDSRPRDHTLERDPKRARQRLLGLIEKLQGNVALDDTVQVLGRGGRLGDFAFAVTSTLGRELVFAASHAIHHYAVLAPHCKAQGIRIGEHFGKAPATVAHERDIAVMNGAAAGTKDHINQELPCKTPSFTA